MKLLCLLIVIVLLAALFIAWRPGFNFRAQKPADYAGLGPVFDPKRHLNGVMDSEGVIYGPDGRVASRFVARMEGQWEGTSGTLREEFTYAKGGTQLREWALELQADGTIRATAPDVIGDGKGVLSGPTLSLSYRIRLDEDAGGHVLDVTDWLYLMENGTIMNRSQMRKFGVTVAELIATMRPSASVAEIGKDDEEGGS
nr:DUF3833 family protein [uncultured Celeribacter sp.]